MQRLEETRYQIALVLFVFFLATLLSVQDARATAEGQILSDLFTVKSTSNSAFSIYAGSDPNCAVGDSSTPCNSCATLTTAITSATTNYFCNRKGIHTNLNLLVSIKSSDTANYPSPVTTTLIKGWIGATQVNNVRNGTYTAGTASELTVTIPWKDLCDAAGVPDCKNNSFSKTLVLAFDKDGTATTPGSESIKIEVSFRYVGTSPLQRNCGSAAARNMYSGLCEYTVFPGDKKVYVTVGGYTDPSANPELRVENLVDGTALGTADASNMRIKALRLYYTTHDPNSNDWSVFKVANMDYKDVTLDTTATGIKISDKKVKGLENGSSYIFLAANVDEGGNEHSFFDPTDLNGVDGSIGGNLGGTQSATPQPVYGLLDNQKCFIATAAYGSGDATQVETLRQFRNEFLLRSDWGQKFVRTYYQISPPIAEFISEREILKRLVRNSLEPLVLIAILMLKFGAIALFGLILFSGITFFGLLQLLKRRKAS